MERESEREREQKYKEIKVFKRNAAAAGEAAEGAALGKNKQARLN